MCVCVCVCVCLLAHTGKCTETLNYVLEGGTVECL